MIRSGDHNDRLKEHHEMQKRQKGETRCAGGGAAASPTLLGVMTDREVRDALLRRIEEAGPDDRRRMLLSLAVRSHVNGYDTEELAIRLVFADWLDKDHRSVYSTEKGVDLSMGQFHSGTTFDGAIRLDSDDRGELESAMASGYTPVFHLIPGAD